MKDIILAVSLSLLISLFADMIMLVLVAKEFLKRWGR